MPARGCHHQGGKLRTHYQSFIGDCNTYTYVRASQAGRCGDTAGAHKCTGRSPVPPPLTAVGAVRAECHHLHHRRSW
jgi:hypothetical protein